MSGQAAVDVEWLAGGGEEFGSLTQAASGGRLVAFRAIPDSLTMRLKRRIS